MLVRYFSRIIKQSKILSVSCKKVKSQNTKVFHPCITIINHRTLTHYPIDNELYGLTPDQIQLRETVFNFFQKEIAPIADKIDKEDDFPGLRDFWKKLGELGLLGLTADPQYGGTGMGIFEHCLVLEEFARVSAAISLSYGAHSNLCVNQINRCVI